MINFRIQKFVGSNQYALQLEEFEPVGGFDAFFIAICDYLNETLIQWHRNWEFGIGYMTYNGYKLGLCQREFPYVFSFDCRDETMAYELKEKLEAFFATTGSRYLDNKQP